MDKWIRGTTNNGSHKYHANIIRQGKDLDIKMPRVSIAKISVTYKEIVANLLKASDLKMPSELTMINQYFLPKK